jgi:class 3 adenylate cyclase/predicted ATPase
MQCPKCQFESPEGSTFCGDCGAPLELSCPSCGSNPPPGFKFCNNCGHDLQKPSEELPKALSFDEKLAKIQRYLPKGLTEKILSQKDRIEGERKQVTVLFCDMVGFTALSERIGPDDAYEIMDQIYEILIHKVHDYEGTVNEMTGDGVMALFGAPIAMEDAPQRAIRSALAIHQEVAKFSDRVKEENIEIPQLKMRIGIHTGPVVVGTLGNDLRVEFKAVGDTVNTASRMEGLAEPGTIYVSQETFQLTEGLFQFEALGEKKVKGKEAPVKIYRVLGSSSRRTRFDVSAERGLTPFIGRERELELLIDGFERTKGGRGQALSIMGEAGLGKSRLLYEFRKAVANEDVTFLEGKCLSYSRNVAYHSVIDILKSNFLITDSDSEAEITEKVKNGIKSLDEDEALTLPCLLELLSVKQSGLEELSLSPETMKDRIIEALNRIVIKGSQIRPLILAIEDLHWVDKSSEEAYKALLDTISGARAFIIFTYRPEYVHTWGGKSYHSQVNMNRISNRQSLAMAANLLSTKDIDRALEDLILEKTEGVPFFIEEFIKSLMSLKIIEKKDKAFRLVRDTQALTIPATIQDVIMARVDTLPEGAKEVLQTGSIIEREFSYDLIKTVTDLPEQELLSHLSALKDFELLYERGIYPQSTYVFKHALTQEVAYNSLLKKRRREVHSKVAGAIELLYSERLEEFCEKLAFHFVQGEIWDKAVTYLRQAGGRAMKKSAYVEAMAHLRKGLELLQTLPETAERAELELALQFDLATSLIVSKGWIAPEVEQAYARAYELCRQAGEPPTLIPVLQGLRRLYALRGDRGDAQKARELGEQLLSLAQRQNDNALLQEAYWALGQTLCFLGELNPARTHLEQSSAFFKPQSLSSQVSRDAAGTQVACLVTMAWVLWVLGYPDQALETSDEALSLAHELSHPFTLAFAFWGMAQLNQYRREVQATLEQTEAMIALSNEQGFPLWMEYGTLLRAWTLVMQGNTEEGIAQIRQIMTNKPAGITNALWPQIYASLIEAYGAAGQAEEGLSMVDEALALVEKTGFRFYEAELHRLQGELLLKQAAPDSRQAETCLHRALDLAHSQQAKSIELRAAMSLSRIWRQQGKKEEACRLLKKIYGWFTNGFDTPDLQEAKALLEELM